MVRIIDTKPVAEGINYIVATGGENDTEPEGKYAQNSVFIKKNESSGVTVTYYDEESETWKE